MRLLSVRLSLRCASGTIACIRVAGSNPVIKTVACMCHMKWELSHISSGKQVRSLPLRESRSQLSYRIAEGRGHESDSTTANCHTETKTNIRNRSMFPIALRGESFLRGDSEREEGERMGERERKKIPPISALLVSG